jgi:hypothetical protein
MDRVSKICLGFVVFLILCCSFVSASKLTFVNTAGVGNGTLTISDSIGTTLVVLNSSESYEVHNNTVYHFDFQPSGLFALHNEVMVGFDRNGTVIPPQLNGIRFYMGYFSDPQVIVETIFLIILILLVVLA